MSVGSSISVRPLSLFLLDLEYFQRQWKFLDIPILLRNSHINEIKKAVCAAENKSVLTALFFVKKMKKANSKVKQIRMEQIGGRKKGSIYSKCSITGMELNEKVRIEPNHKILCVVRLC